MDQTPTSIVARSQPTETQSPVHNDSSFFTFIIALLILIFASGALVLRALLIRRRFRNRVQAAIDAGILPSRTLSHEKPELAEVWVRSASDVENWHALQPVCAATTAEYTQPNDTTRPVAYNASAAARLMMHLGHRPVVATAAVLPRDIEKVPPNHETLQVAVLIAMPAEHHLIPSDDLSTSECASSPKGKMRDLTLLNDDTIPDVMFGVCRFPLSPNDEP